MRCVGFTFGPTALPFVELYIETRIRNQKKGRAFSTADKVYGMRLRV